jgi:hypothetical protein
LDIPSYYYGDNIREDEIGGTCSTHGRNENLYKILYGKPERKVKIWQIIEACEWEDDGIQVAQDRF